MQSGVNDQTAWEDEAEGGAEDERAGSGERGSQPGDDDLATSATPAPEVVADTPVESTQENPAEPALEAGADSFTGPAPDAAADTAPEPASKVGEKRKAEDAVQLEELGVGEVGSGRKFTKIRSWEGKFWPFGWGRGHVDGL